ncbi:hypothetical protein HYQ46_008023 [Verticillium longisporum]|nr:hypothetical protein HYQ46_008023 [Verticillium longisporum]
MGSKKHVLKGTFQPQNNLKPEGGFMGRFRDVGHSVARFLPKFKDDSDDMSAENAPEVNSTQKPHRSGLVSQKATSSRPGDKRRQSPEIDELAEDEKHHAKRQRRSNDLKTPPRVDIAALESRRTVAIAKRDVEEVQRITDQLEGNRLSSRTYQQSSKQPPEAIDSDDELNASPTKELDASGAQDLKFVKLEQPPRETLQKVFENLYQSAPEQMLHKLIYSKIDAEVLILDSADKAGDLHRRRPRPQKPLGVYLLEIE